MSVSKCRAKIFFFILILLLVNLIVFIIFDGTLRADQYFDKRSDGDVYTKKKDWHDYDTMIATLNRSGPGENGAPVLFLEYTKALYERYGFEALLSDLISLNRTLPDVRYEACKTMTYLSKLPKSALIIVFYNERLSTLLRTIHSILNRTPNELIQEIILVDDGSTWADVQAPLDDYLQRHLPVEQSKVRLLRLAERRGLMVARMFGARNATKDSEVLIFLDSHFEMLYNWLPPLLEPIALNAKACTIPSFDRINFQTFRYEKMGEFRGYFDWYLNFQIRALQHDEQNHPSRNFHAYVMMGGALAIRADFFWQLGGFDEGMLLWGGEQYELSFKIWMCGGEIIHVPCSRMGHLFRDPKTKGNINLYNDYAFVDRNVRRLIDVWFDEEHRQYVLNHRPKAATIDPGDLTSRIALRDSLKCHSFSWLLQYVMPDIKRIFPPIEPSNFGNGTIRAFLQQEICIALDLERNQIVLQKCNSSDMRHIWTYSWRCEIRTASNTCLEVDVNHRHVNAYHCHLFGGNQRWFYDAKSKWIVSSNYKICIVANFERHRVDVAPCDSNNLRMKWLLDSYNQTAIEKCRKERT